MLKYEKFITRQMLRDNPEALFVFGDNFAKKGYGGQAKEMRDEPNAVGIPTKRYPNTQTSAFLTDDDFDEWYEKSHEPCKRLIDHLYDGGIVYWPEDGIGTGLARLEENAPRIYAAIEVIEERLKFWFNNSQENW